MTWLLRIILLCSVLPLVLASKAASSGNATEKEHASIHLATIKFDYVKQPLIIAVFIFAAGIAKLAFHHAEFISSRVPESCLLIILGIIVGAIMSQTMESANCTQPQPEVGGNISELADVNVEHREPRQGISMTSSLFFLCLLPPYNCNELFLGTMHLTNPFSSRKLFFWELIISTTLCQWSRQEVQLTNSCQGK